MRGLRCGGRWLAKSPGSGIVRDMMNSESYAADVRIFQHGDYRERVLRAREMTPGERLDMAFHLSQLMLEARMRAVQAQYPEWSDEEVGEELRRQMAAEREVEERGYFSSVNPFPLPR